MKKTETLRIEFLRMYPNLLMSVRKDICTVIDKEPMSFNVCWLEIEQKTEFGDRILVYLNKLEII